MLTGCDTHTHICELRCDGLRLDVQGLGLDVQGLGLGLEVQGLGLGEVIEVFVLKQKS